MLPGWLIQVLPSLCFFPDEDLNGLEVDKDLIEVNNITRAWVALQDTTIQRSLSSIETGVMCLHKLCDLIFSGNRKKTAKEKHAGI